MHTIRRGLIGLAGATMIVAAQASVAFASVSGADAIRAAIVDRLGAGVDVRILTLDLAGSAPVFREARPDPSARLGRPVRFTLVTTTGAALPVVVTLSVVGDYAVTARDVARGDILTAADLRVVNGELIDVPLKRLPTLKDLSGARALRALPAGTTLLASFATVRRAIEPGDRVTVVAAAATVEVTAMFVAADGGAVGDVIRVVNPDTRRYLRGRVRDDGLVEVIDGR